MMYDDPAASYHPTGLLDLRVQALVRHCISASQVRRIACQERLDVRKAIEFWNKEKQKCST